jgi:hypothetical protein
MTNSIINHIYVVGSDKPTKAVEETAETSEIVKGIIDNLNNYDQINAEFAATEYKRQRAPEYPSLTDFADAYYWAQKGDNTKMKEYVAKCDAVKNKYPKVNDAN